MGKKNFYAVKIGRREGIYTTRDECKAQVNGFRGAIYKGFATRGEAEAYMGPRGPPFEAGPFSLGGSAAGAMSSEEENIDAMIAMDEEIRAEEDRKVTQVAVAAPEEAEEHAAKRPRHAAEDADVAIVGSTYRPTMGNKRFYAVKVGWCEGIYTTWDECKAQVNGFRGAIYKGFATRGEAEAYMGPRGPPFEAGPFSLGGSAAGAMSSEEENIDAMIAMDEEIRAEEDRKVTQVAVAAPEEAEEHAAKRPRHAAEDADVAIVGSQTAEKGNSTGFSSATLVADSSPSRSAAGVSCAAAGLPSVALFSSSTKKSPPFAPDGKPDVSLAQQDVQPEQLDAGQQRALDAALSGQNLFLTGGPGTGKSFTLRKAIQALRVKHGDSGVLVAAPTGVAALIAEGQTLHSKPGPGVPRGTTEAFGNMRSQSSWDFWRKVRVLVIDEISMVDAEFFDWYMTAVPRVQLILCGDFNQLPPVPEKQGSLDDQEHLKNCIFAARRKDRQESRDVGGLRNPAADDGGWLDMTKNTPFGMKETTGKHVFQSVAWRKANLAVLHLTVVHRTREPVLLDALNDLRSGLPMSANIAELVRRTSRPLPAQDGVEPTTLYPRKVNVEGMNEKQLKKLDAATAQVFTANDAVEVDEHAPWWVTEAHLRQDAFFKTDCQASRTFELRLKAQVMLLRNEQPSEEAIRGPTTQRLVNGSRGVVIAFDYACPLRSNERVAGPALTSSSSAQSPSARATDGVQPTCGCGNPAAWACIRRRCGVCCSSAACARHAGGGGGGGDGRMAAVKRKAEPRAGDDYDVDPPAMPEGPPPESALLPAQWEAMGDGLGWRNRETGQRTDKRPSPQLYPVVRFVGSNGNPGRVKLIRPEPFEKAVYLKGTLTRTQVPLALAWALTIHKGQGSTIDYLCVDLEGSFAEGGSYVAISRASSISGLEIRNFSQNAVMSSPLVRSFYAAVDAGQHAAFLTQPGLWWGCPILDHPHQRWASLYRRNKVFAAWADELPTPVPMVGVPAPPLPQQQGQSPLSQKQTQPWQASPPSLSPGQRSGQQFPRQHQQTRQQPAHQRDPAPAQSVPAQASPQSRPTVTLCKCNCNRPVCPGLYQGFRGPRPYDTCCRPCATHRVVNGEGHDVACEQRYLQSL